MARYDKGELLVEITRLRLLCGAFSEKPKFSSLKLPAAPILHLHRNGIFAVQHKPIIIPKWSPNASWESLIQGVTLLYFRQCVYGS